MSPESSNDHEDTGLCPSAASSERCRESSIPAEAPDATTAARNRAYYRRNHILLGDQYDRVMDELRAAHDGELDIATVASFVARVVAEVAEAKN